MLVLLGIMLLVATPDVTEYLLVINVFMSGLTVPFNELSDYYIQPFIGSVLVNLPQVLVSQCCVMDYSCECASC